MKPTELGTGALFEAQKDDMGVAPYREPLGTPRDMVGVPAREYRGMMLRNSHIIVWFEGLSQNDGGEDQELGRRMLDA